jgi:cytochrome P450
MIPSAVRESSAGYMRTYDELPGPEGSRLLGNARQIRPESFHRQLEGWATEFGSPFRLRIAKRRFIAISDPDLIASVLRQRPDVFLKGPRLQQVSADIGFAGVFSANGEAWRRQRQLVMSGLDPSHLRTYMPALVEVTHTLAERWRHAADQGESIDLLADLMRYTVDVTTAMAFGRNLDTLRQGDTGRIQQHLNVIFPTLFRRVLAPVDIEHWIPRPGLRSHVKALEKAVHEFIAAARAELASNPELAAQPRNLLQAMVAAASRQEGGFTDAELAGNVMTMLLAGEDTTANTVAWLIWLLHDNPEAWERARREVDAVLGGGEQLETTEQLAKLNFLDACANEAMRLKPVAPINIMEAGQDTTIGDVAVPKGTFVICIMRLAGMAPDRFEAPEKFEPQRWMGDVLAAAPGLHSAKRVVMPFGAGPRVCPGRYLALAEVKLVMGMLLRHLDIREMRAPPGGPGEKLALTMSPTGLALYLVRRAGLQR